jgi:threonine synthase
LKLANGEVIAVSDPSIEKALILLGKCEGIFAEPSGVAALAGLESLIHDGTIDRSDTIVVPITGSGFKDLDTPDRLLPEVPVISPEISELKSALDL